MTFDEYQKKARTTAIYADLDRNLWYPTLGLCGESGEVAEKVKKVYRDEDGVLTQVKRTELEKELGDVLWYVANLACEARLSLDSIAKGNLEKLSTRKEAGTLHGDGDNR